MTGEDEALWFDNGSRGGSESLAKQSFGRLCSELEEEIERDKKSAELYGKAFVALMDALTSSSSEKAKNRALPIFLDEIQSLSFCVKFCRWDGGSPWAFIFHSIGKHLGRSLQKNETELLSQQCETFAKTISSSLPSSDSSHLLSSLVNHLSSHSIDPCNFFVGYSPSSFSFQFPLNDSSSSLLRSSSDPPSSLLFHEHSAPSSSPLSRNCSASPTIAASPSLPSPHSARSLSSPLLPPPISPTTNSPSHLPNLDAFLFRWEKSLSLSPYLIEKEVSDLIGILQHSCCHFPGELLAVNVGALSIPQRETYTNSQWVNEGPNNNYIFCRLKCWQSSSSPVEIWVSCAEDVVATVPANSVFYFDWKKIESKNSVSDCVSNIIDPFKKKVKFHVVSSVKKALEKHSISLNCAKKFPEVDSLPAAYLNHKRFKSALLSGLGPGIMKNVEEEGEDLIIQWFKMLPRASRNVNKRLILAEIQSLQSELSPAAMNHLREEFKFSKAHLYLLRKKIHCIANGSRKNNVCGWWLSEIEKQVNKFLERRGFDKHALPQNYTSVAPESLEAVEINLEVILDLFESEEIKDFVDKLTRKIYVSLDKFLKELEYFLDPSMLWLDAMGFDDDPIPEQQIAASQKDLDYLQKMKKMDKEISLKRKKEKRAKSKKGEEEEEKEKWGRFQMTDVVPVAGLIMAKFTMYECEHLTALELWGKKTDREIIIPEGLDQVMTIYTEESWTENDGNLNSDEEFDMDGINSDGKEEEQLAICSIQEETEELEICGVQENEVNEEEVMEICEVQENKENEEICLIETPRHPPSPPAPNTSTGHPPLSPPLSPPSPTIPKPPTVPLSPPVPTLTFLGFMREDERTPRPKQQSKTTKKTKKTKTPEEFLAHLHNEVMEKVSKEDLGEFEGEGTRKKKGSQKAKLRGAVRGGGERKKKTQTERGEFLPCREERELAGFFKCGEEERAVPEREMEKGNMERGMVSERQIFSVEEREFMGNAKGFLGLDSPREEEKGVPEGGRGSVGKSSCISPAAKRRVILKESSVGFL